MAAATPGSTVRVRALYSYSYEDDAGLPVCMAEGDEFHLIRKTNAQWWHVRKVGDNKQPIYVPANYVEEVSDSDDDDAFEDARSQDSPKVPHEGRSLDSPKLKQSELIRVKTLDSFQMKEQNRLSTFGQKNTAQPSSASGSSRGDPDSDPGLLTPDEDGSEDTSGVKKKKLQASKSSDGHLPEYANLDEYRQAAGISPQSPPQHVQTDQSHEYMNLQDIQAHIKISPEPPPPPKPGKSLPVKVLGEGWETHVDPSKNRPFYYNKLTGETSWKPPRLTSPRREDSEKKVNTELSPDKPANGTPSVVDADGKPLPKGWIVEVTDSGERWYINTATDERWQSSVDAAGKTYYYKEKSSDSMWELPEVEPVRHNSIDSAIKELEEVRSRVSGVKHADRQNRARSMMAFTNDLNKSLAKTRTLPSKLPVSPVQEGIETDTSQPSTPIGHFNVESFKKELQDLLQVPGPEGSVSLIVKTPSPLETSQIHHSPPSSLQINPPSPGPVLREPMVSNLKHDSTPGQNSPGHSHDSIMVQSMSNVTGLRESIMAQGGFRESTMLLSPPGSHDTAMVSGGVRNSQHGLPKDRTKPSDKKGVLNKTKIMEAGKKLNKKWNQTYMVLTGSTLLFFKDAKTAQKSPMGKPETVIDMSSAEIDWGNKETSSRKNVLQLTCDGAVYLLQTDDGPKIQEWNIALKQAQDFAIPMKVMSPHGPNVAALVSQLADKLPPLDQVSKPPTKAAPPPVNNKMKRSKSTKILAAQKAPSNEPLRRTKSTKTLPNSSRRVDSLKPSRHRDIDGMHEVNVADVNDVKEQRMSPIERSVAFGVTHVQFTESSDDVKGVEESAPPKNKIKERLMSLLTRRPTRDSLQEKGIIREQIFGSTIMEICERENSTIPRFVMDCTAAIETRGLSVDGIYRLSGNLAQVQKLRFAVDNCAAEPYDLSDPQWDFHVLTGALKLFFRELKEPLFPFEFYDKLKRSIMLSDRSKKVQTMKDLVKVLPKANYDTTKLLFKHLREVMSYSAQNRMQAQNIAIVFGPTLLWPKDEAPNMAVSTVFQNQIVECVLLEYDFIFS